MNLKGVENMSYTDEDRKGILKGQCINIAFQDFNSQKATSNEIKERINRAHEIYNQLMLEKFLIW